MLDVVTIERAGEIIAKHFKAEYSERTVSLGEARGLTLCEDVLSDEFVPAFDRSTVDGFAVRASDTFGCSGSIPAMLKLAGEVEMGGGGASIGSGECASVPTGGMLPRGADAAVMWEHCERLGGEVCVYAPASPGQNVIRKGDDLKRGGAVLKSGTLLKEKEIGVLAAAGKSEVKVFCPPRVAVISTGDELVDIKKTPENGEIRDVNSSLLGALVTSAGCEVRQFGIVPDDKNKLKQALCRAVEECAVLLVSGGTSAGERDCAAPLIKELGTLLFHGLAVKPGKPTAFGLINNRAVFALPGNPVAAYFVFLLLVRPMLLSGFGRTEAPMTKTGTLARAVSSNHGRKELVPVKITGDAIEPIPSRSGLIATLRGADGYIVVPRDCEGLACGEQVTAYYFP